MAILSILLAKHPISIINMQKRSLHIRPLNKKNLRVRPSPISGYGVFAEDAIKKGDTVEECPILYIREDRQPNIADISFYDTKEDTYLIALGCGSIYNHSDDCNLFQTIDHKAAIMIFHASRDIEAGEELTHLYSDVWFENRAQKRLRVIQTTAPPKMTATYFTHEQDTCFDWGSSLYLAWA